MVVPVAFLSIQVVYEHTFNRIRRQLSKAGDKSWTKHVRPNTLVKERIMFCHEKT